MYIYTKNKQNSLPVTYIEAQNSFTEKAGMGSVKPFASIHGQTYTFSWCQSSSRIVEKNRIYFTDEEEAKQKGYRLSKLCSK